MIFYVIPNRSLALLTHFDCLWSVSCGFWIFILALPGVFFDETVWSDWRYISRVSVGSVTSVCDCVRWYATIFDSVETVNLEIIV